MAQLDDIEKKLFNLFLDELDNYQSAAGSNDFKWPAYVPPEKRKEILIEFHKYNKSPPNEGYREGEEFEPVTHDGFVFYYLRRKLFDD